MTAKPDRIKHSRHVTAACAVDTVPLLAARVTNLLWWGRSITVAHRWLDSDNPVELKVGLTVDKEVGDRAIRLSVKDDCAHYGVHLAPGIEGFSFSAYASDGNATEEDVWKRYHAGDRREITTVTVNGGGPGDGGPGREDGLTIRYWNGYRVGREWVIGFDTPAYSAAWRAREDRGWKAGGESIEVDYCKAYAQEGQFRVRCGCPLAGATCLAEDHVETPGQAIA